MYVVFYTTRSKTGTPQPQGATNVFPTDHWEIEESKAGAEARYNEIVDTMEVLHLAGIAPIDPKHSTDWM
jgi:hypothetical protein